MANHCGNEPVLWINIPSVYLRKTGLEKLVFNFHMAVIWFQLHPIGNRMFSC